MTSALFTEKKRCSYCELFGLNMEALAEDLGLDCTQADAERDHASPSIQIGSKYKTVSTSKASRSHTSNMPVGSKSFHVSAVRKRKFCNTMHSQVGADPKRSCSSTTNVITKGTLNGEGISHETIATEHTACDSIDCDFCIIFRPNMEALAEDLGMPSQAEACCDKIGQNTSALKSCSVPTRSFLPTRSSSNELQSIDTESCTHTARTRSQSVQVDRGPNGHLSQLDDTDL